MTRKTVLVTGGAGFIGSNIVARLCEDPTIDVVVCDRLRDADSGKWRNLAKSPIADFVAPEDLFAWLAKRGGDVELVIHMGAVSSTTEPDADKIIQSNFVLSRDLWDWCAEYGRRMIYASSAATYGDGTLGFDGKDDIMSLKALRPLNAYGWSKALFDIYAVREAARGRKPLQWVGLKFFNVYGPNEGHKDSMKSVVAQVWPKVAAGEGVKLFKSHNPDYEDGGQLRDFVYVRDVADIVGWLADNPQVNGVFNLGSGQARTFRALAEATFQAVGRQPDISYVDMPEVLRGKYQYFTEARMERLREAGYTAPMTSLEDGVADYVAGFLNTDDPYR
ncbi:ADP-glyceromanno-heptose 6-epimerase [Caulobacter sp. ErkDOM-YI]|uniref:ADP-glyceromanno-heptose 6-epimerase n=1 Tax=unclassified Caulobacter TaxID=2648921 RepID=UPI003AF61D4E